MAKKKNDISQNSVVTNRMEENKAAGVDSMPTASVQEKSVKTVNGAGAAAVATKKKDVKANGKPNIFKRMGRAFREMGSEMKKVNWLSAKQIFVRLGVVLLVVLIFLLVVTGFDYLCNFLLGLLIPQATV
ncbi:MAG: preprotein translocase subunit SecE [Clostridia bacterium]